MTQTEISPDHRLQQRGTGDALANAFHRKQLRVFVTARNPGEHLKKLNLEILQMSQTMRLLSKLLRVSRPSLGENWIS